MTPGENRDIERRLENTYREGDCVRAMDAEQEELVIDVEQEGPVVDAEQGEPMADDSDAKKFGEMLLKSVRDLSRQIEVMGQRFIAVEARQRETPRGFQIGEGSGTSHHLQEHDATQHMASPAPTRSTMPTFLAADTGAGAQ